MRKALLLAVLMLAVVSGGIFVGCSNDDPAAPVANTDDETVTSIELRMTHNLISGLIDESRSEQITAIAKNAGGVGVQGVRISMGIVDPQDYKGTISRTVADSLTDETGSTVATYTVVLDRDADVTVFAQAGQVQASKVMQLRVREAEGVMALEVGKKILTVPPDQTKSTTITATLVDEDGLAIPGVQINFSTSPATLGFVDSDTGTTGNNGRVTRNFTSVVNQYGLCEVIATVGEMEERQTIEVRQVAGPEYCGITATPPSINIAEGQDGTSTIKAVVTDANGVGVPGTQVLFELAPYEGGNIFGSLTSVDSTTNDDGELSTTFHTRGAFGTEWIVARVVPAITAGEGDAEASAPVESNGDLKGLKIDFGNGVIADINEDELFAELLMTVESLEDGPRSMDISATPDFFNIASDSTGQAVIEATVRDEFRNGIPNLEVKFSANFGTLGQATRTDSTGKARINFFIRPSIDMPGLNEQATATVTATIPGTNWSASVDIDIKPQAREDGSLTLSVDRRSIWADGPGLSFATLQAVLHDAEGQVLANEPIQFLTSFPNSVVLSPIMTDSSGRATSVFDDNGVPSTDENGAPDSVLVTARYEPMGLSATMRILIAERNPVQHIALNANAAQMMANSGDSTTVRVVCRLNDMSPAPAGTLVNFGATIGSFSESVVAVTGNGGACETSYIAGNMVGLDSLQAFVMTPQDTAYSNIVTINLIAGPPSTVALSIPPDQRELTTNDPTSTAIVTATVMDTVGSPVAQGTPVNFSISLGTITQSAITDENGQAVAQVRPGVESGLAIINCSVPKPDGGTAEGTATITFISGTPNSITLEATPLLISVAGTGGNTTSTLRATVKDPNGNLVEHPVSVKFELINEPLPPAGCTIGPDSSWFMSTTSGGIAVASLNSGTQIGGKLLRATTWADSGTENEREVSVVLATVAVVAGPPFELDIDVNDDGLDAGGGAWSIEVSARVWDIHRNPVANNIPVVFTVNPDIANIDPGHTGNEGASGGSVQGLAFSRLVYNSVNTFDDIEIAAEVRIENGQIVGSRQHVLPLQDGNLELNIDPGNWMFREGQEVAEVRCWVVLTDGHQIPINNAPILFNSNRSRFWWYNFNSRRLEEYFPNPVRKYTGIQDPNNNELAGQATVFLVAEEADIFLDPFTLEVTVQINASVEGYDEVSSDPGFIFFTRPA